jgi:hypothetical protein
VECVSLEERRRCTHAQRWKGSGLRILGIHLSYGHTTNRGWIRYDVEDSRNVFEEHCIVVGSTENSEYYYILLARPTGVDHEYKRVGIGQVQKNCLVKERVDMRVI